MLEVDAPAEAIGQVASDFQAALRMAATDFEAVLDVSVEPEPAKGIISVRMVLEARGQEELDDVADRLLDRALAMLDDPEESDELTVVESALVPA